MNIELVWGFTLSKWFRIWQNLTPTCFDSWYVLKISIKRAMVNFCYTSFHSQYNESLICATIQYAFHISIYGRSATINTLVGTNSVYPLVGWLVGDKLFSSHTDHHMGQWGGGCSWIFTRKRLGTWRGVGSAGFSSGQQFFGQSRSFLILSCVQWSPPPREIQNSSKSKER